jgi:enoyl-CoA hydratase
MIQVRASEDVLILTLDRPEQRNAMSAALVEAMIATLEALDPSVRAVMLVGAGRGFCAGSDLAALAAMDNDARSEFETDSARLALLIAAIDVPVIAAVHGFAIGGGLTLAAACDIIVTTADANWSLPEVPIGLFPAWGLGAVEERVGRPAARRLSWGIDTLDGTAAAAMGLADHVAEDAQAAALDIAARLAALPILQAQSVKRYFRGDSLGAEGDRRANALFMAATKTSEAEASFVRFSRRPS